MPSDAFILQSAGAIAGACWALALAILAAPSFIRRK